MRTTKILMLVFGLSLLAPAVAAQTDTVERVAPVAFGEPFPAARYDNLNPALTGVGSVDLATLVGKKPVIFCYWIAGNRRSEAVLRELETLVAGLGDKVSMVSIVAERPGREAPVIVDRVKQLGLRYPVLNDRAFRLGQQLTVQTVPHISLVDAKGALRMTNGAALVQTVEYNLDVAGVIERAAKTGSVGTYGFLPKYYPVNELIGKACPDFQAPQVKDGVVRSRSSLLSSDALNVLVFWSVDCPHCKKSLPEINEWLKQNGDGINLISAAKASDAVMKTRTKEFCKYYDFVFPTLLDEGRELADLFMVTATPTVLIVRPDGVIDSVIVSGEDIGSTLLRKKRELLNKS